MKSGSGIESLRGKPLVAAILSVCSVGFILFGYDQGVMSGVVVSDEWLRIMGNPSTVMIGTINSIYDVGAVLGAIIASFISERLGRKRMLLVGTGVCAVGGILMGSAFGRPQFMVGRVMTGVGIGLICSVTPVYQGEISRPKDRGWMICCQLTILLFGLMLAYWMNYGLYFHSGSIQWRFPLLLQLVFCIYIFVVTPFLPDTPRWLMLHRGEEDGLAVLARLRGTDETDLKTQREKEEIKEAIRIEQEEAGSWADLFKDHGISGSKRFYLALGIQFMQQMTGINIITYYAPTLFKEILGMSQQTALLMGCLLQVWYLLASIGTWFVIDRLGRRFLFITMAIGQGIFLILEAVTVYNGTKSGAIAAIFFIFAYETCFAWGWIQTVWIYPAEILPLKTRARGAALATAVDFLGNFLVVEVSPPGLKRLGWKYYLIFGAFNLVNAVIVWCFYPETGGIALEAMDQLFLENNQQSTTKSHWYQKLQWDVVPKSTELAKLSRKGEPFVDVSHTDTGRHLQEKERGSVEQRETSAL